jgi:hypothetical protein
MIAKVWAQIIKVREIGVQRERALCRKGIPAHPNQPLRIAAQRKKG